MDTLQKGQINRPRTVSESSHITVSDISHRDRPSANPNNNNRSGPPDDSPSGSDDGNDQNENQRRRRFRHENDRRTNQRNAENDQLIDNLKPLSVGSWKLCFSGDATPANARDTDIHRFLGLIESYRRTGNLSYRAVMTQVGHLLAGSAQDWFQLEGQFCQSWTEFVTKIKANFLTSTHDNELYAKATRRKQGKNESVATYINQMRLIFNAMSEPMSETFKLFLIRQNLHPRYTAIVASHCPRTVNDVMRIAREVETTRQLEAEPEVKPKSRYRAANTVEKATNSTDNSDTDESEDSISERAKVAVIKTDKVARNSDKKKSVAIVNTENPIGSVEAACFICGSQDHLQRQCKQKWPKHCFRCGMPDVVLRDCKNCNGELPKNAKANSAAEQPSSATK